MLKVAQIQELQNDSLTTSFNMKERIEDRVRREASYEAVRCEEVFDAKDFVRSIDEQIQRLERKGISPQLIALRSWGYNCLGHYIAAEGCGHIAKLGDSGIEKIYEFRGLRVVNISMAKEEHIIKATLLNFVKVYGE